MSRQDEVSASPGMLTAAQLARRLRLENERLQVSSQNLSQFSTFFILKYRSSKILLTIVVVLLFS